MAIKETSLSVRFWAPYQSTFENADTSVEIKAPEEGNKEKRRRNQSIARTRAGNVLVYDRGNDYNTNFSLEFKQILDIERAQLLLFLEAIQWASTKICYQDMYGDIYIVRVLKDGGIEYEDLGTDLKRGPSRIRWNFSLDLLNLTDNLAELSIADGNVSNALTLHINNVNDPHNPEVCTSIDITDSDKILEGYFTSGYRSIIWTVCAQKDGASATYIVCLNHDRVDTDTDATAVSIQQLLLNEQGDVSPHLIFTGTLDGVGLVQIMNLRCEVNTDGWHVCIRRTKIGSL
jgi:hypothetical protein